MYTRASVSGSRSQVGQTRGAASRAGRRVASPRVPRRSAPLASPGRSRTPGPRAPLPAAPPAALPPSLRAIRAFPKHDHQRPRWWRDGFPGVHVATHPVLPFAHDHDGGLSGARLCFQAFDPCRRAPHGGQTRIRRTPAPASRRQTGQTRGWGRSSGSPSCHPSATSIVSITPPASARRAPHARDDRFQPRQPPRQRPPSAHDARPSPARSSAVIRSSSVAYSVTVTSARASDPMAFARAGSKSPASTAAKARSSAP